MPNLLARLNPIFVFLEETLPSLLLAFMVLLVFADVLGRYLLNSPIAGTSELAVALFVWQVFLGAAGGVRKRLHVGVDLFSGRLKGRSKKALAVTTNLLVLIFSAVVAKLGWDFALFSQIKTLQMVQLSFFYVYGVVALAALLSAIHSVNNILEALKEPL